VVFLAMAATGGAALLLVGRLARITARSSGVAAIG
jgi:hypothetical protein